MIDELVLQFERLVLPIDEGMPTDASIARKCLQAIIDPQFEREGRTLSDSLEAAEQSAPEHRRRAALLMLRALGGTNILANQDHGTGYERRVVTLISHGTPDIIKYFQVEDKKQTFERFVTIEQVHTQLLKKLTALPSISSHPETFLNARQDVLKALNQEIVKSYFSLYDIRHIQQAANTIFSQLSAIVATKTHEFPILLTRARALVEAEIEWAVKNSTFLSVDHYSPFLIAALDVCCALDTEARGRFSAHIRPDRPEDRLLEKRYPLHEPGKIIKILIPLRNEGPGIASDVTAQVASGSDNIVLNSHLVHLGDILPGEFALSLDVLILSAISSFPLLVEISWTQTLTTDRTSAEFTVPVRGQKTNIDWAALSYSEPYSLEVAEGDEFVGRREKLRALSSRLLRPRMVSSYITGPKRIGKSSLALRVQDEVVRAGGTHFRFLFLDKGDYAHEDPRRTLRMLGERVSEFLTGELPISTLLPALEFDGTLAPLNRLADLVLAHTPERRFVIALDEFDGINPELYRIGALAETFFSNIRTFSAKRNIALLLVGGENMPFIISAQGDELNKFSRETLTYFSRVDEWQDFCELVQNPVYENITWYTSALNALFDQTNGHPYYTKLICAEIFKRVVEEHDAEITAAEVRLGTQRTISSLDTNAFAHLWMDGIGGTREETEVKILKRQRVLVAIGRTLRLEQPLTIENINTNKGLVPLSAAEIAAILQDFGHRGIVEEQKGAYTFALPLFRDWLKDAGVNTLIADRLGDELSAQLEAAEDLAYVRDTEIVSVTGGWSAYKGRPLTGTEVRAWLDQVEKRSEQRILFKILQHIRFFSELQIREYLQSAHRTVAKHLPVFTKRPRHDRRNDVLVTYVDGPAKSGASYAAKYAEDNGISNYCVKEMTNFAAHLADHENQFDVTVSGIVIVDDIAATGRALVENVQKFIQINKECLDLRNPVIRVVVLAATPEGQTKIRERFRSYANMDIDLVVCEPLSRNHMAFSSESKVWDSGDQMNEARALCRRLGSALVKKAPLGYGDLGVLVVFPDTCPNNALPLLYASGDLTFHWKPLFPRPVN